MSLPSATCSSTASAAQRFVPNFDMSGKLIDRNVQLCEPH
jgi:hypothetical protein